MRCCFTNWYVNSTSPVTIETRTLYVFLALFHFHSSFFDVKTLGEANELHFNTLECTMNWQRNSLSPRLVTFSPHGMYHRCQGRRFLSTRVSFYPNSVSTFNLTRFTTSGNINPNPGPSSNGNSAEQGSVRRRTVVSAASNNNPKCTTCKRAVTRTHRPIECDICFCWCHIKRGRVKSSEYDTLQSLNHFYWNCPFYKLRTLPFADASFLDSNLDDDLASEPDEDVFTTLKTTMGNIKNLKIGHININGLVNKLTDI